MKVQAYILVLLLLGFSQKTLQGDIIAPSSSYYDGGMSSSFEMLISAEKAITSNFSVLLWGGAGIITTIIPGPFDAFNSGVEGALELRGYTGNEEMKKWFIGSYYGVGYMYTPSEQNIDSYEYTLIQSFGVKVGYKFVPHSFKLGNVKIRADIEPYASFGLTSYYQSEDSSLLSRSDWSAPWLNLGLRAVLELPF